VLLSAQQLHACMLACGTQWRCSRGWTSVHNSASERAAAAAAAVRSAAQLQQQQQRVHSLLSLFFFRIITQHPSASPTAHSRKLAQTEAVRSHAVGGVFLYSCMCSCISLTRVLSHNDYESMTYVSHERQCVFCSCLMCCCAAVAAATWPM
jgi:hypothetical protein